MNVTGQRIKKVHFRKYHGLGNDYLVIDPNIHDVDLTPDTIRLICDRNFGIGADGILYGPVKSGDNLIVRIFNPDGSEAEKSGNGLRIFAKYLFENQYVDKKNFSIETSGGIVEAYIEDDSASLIKINMGKMTFRSTKIPVRGRERDVVNEELQVNGVKYMVTCLSVGNPHCVIPLDEVTEEKAKELGPEVENHNMFPNRINMQLMKVIDRANIEIRIWERGAGYTLASGSSSCAAAGAAYKLGMVDSKINVKMPGGELFVEISKNEDIYLTGAVEGVFEGCFHPDLKEKILRIR
ncbi:MAG: diaminopimelate epimerase [Planctomycetes bacterium RBG_13_50_24]|nr:MAG: diaminopimelate epimerase [Planctomycetes bacterium RBG_13_50_24]